jgi:hypothetical protein
MTTYGIPLANLQKCIQEQNITFRAGDIPFIRSGFIATYTALDDPARIKISQVNPPHFAGMEQSEEVLRWVWENKFAAVAGDAPGWEAWRTSPILCLYTSVLSPISAYLVYF